MKKLAPLLEILDTDWGIHSTLTVQNGLWILVTDYNGKTQVWEADNFIILNQFLSAFHEKLVDGEI